jgi:single-strand DNA-binding protein
MASYNRVILMGNLTRDPEHRQLASGQAVCRLGLASNRQFKNKQTGMMVQEVCFVDVDVWGPQAESCNQYLQKGRPVLVEGRLKLDSWVDNDGQKRSKHSIVADRVTFLAATSQATEQGGDENFSHSEEPSEGVQSESAAPAKKAEPARAKAARKSDSGEAESTGEVNLQEPFEDDLPF